MEIVRNSQNLLDIAIQTTGDADNALDIALVNGLCLTDDLIAGQLLSVPDTLLRNENILSLLRATTAAPATAITAANITDAPFEGIEFWTIEYDFTIS